MVGGLWLMHILNFNFSIAVGVGFIALAGVAVEIGVIMLVYLYQAWHYKKLDAEESKQKLEAKDLTDAIREGAAYVSPSNDDGTNGHYWPYSNHVRRRYRVRSNATYRCTNDWWYGISTTTDAISTASHLQAVETT